MWFTYAAVKEDKVGRARWRERERTMVDDAILQQSLTEVNPFLWVSCLTNFHQPRHKLTEETKTHTHLGPTLTKSLLEISSFHYGECVWSAEKALKFLLIIWKRGKNTNTTFNTIFHLNLCDCGNKHGLGKADWFIYFWGPNLSV